MSKKKERMLAESQDETKMYTVIINYHAQA